MKARLTTLLLALLVVGGCTQPAGNKTAGEDASSTLGLPKAHSMSPAEARHIIGDARDNLKIIMRSAEATAPLTKALTGTALKELTDRITSDLAANRIKMRKYDNLKLSVENYTKGVAGVTMTFTDNSYTIDAGTKKVLTKPSGQRLKLLLALKKIKGRWLIFEIFSRETKKPGA